jgi:hypothetical protein
MPTTKETVKTTILVGAEWDKKSLKELDRDFGKVRKKLSGMKMDWKGVSRESTTAVRDIKNISNAAAEFSKDLSHAARSSIKDLAKLGKELDAAKKKARELKDKAASASTPEEEKAAAVGISEAQKEVEKLTRQVKDHRKVDKQYVQELKHVVKTQKKYSEELKKTASYTGKDFRKDFSSSMGKSYSGGRKGGPMTALKGVHGVYKAGKQYSAGVSARSALAKSAAGGAGGGAGPGGLAVGLSKLVPILGGAIAGFAAFLGFIMKCSDAITAMNKTLLDGTGFANDFTSGSKAYTSALDQMRSGSKDATLGLLKFGGTTETTAKTVNAYMKEASGSIIQTRDTMKSLGGGDVTKGIELLSKNALLYGKALGMETTDVALMMGKLEQEVGLGAGQVQDVMGDIVKAAATSNMPVSKFMGIFHSVTPDLELYINRIEELTGVMKLLSKNMSAADVKKFMDAFSKGFQGKSFSDRVKDVVVANAGGVDVSKTLKEDFEKKADVIAISLGESGDAWRKAFKAGDKGGMQAALIQAKADGAKGATIGEAQKLGNMEATRKKGGVLNLATAVKGAGIGATMKIIEAQISAIDKTHKQGDQITGMQEQVAESRGISQEQITALNSFNASMNLYTKSLKDYGSTGSISMDKALKEIIASRTPGRDPKDVSLKEMALASSGDIESAVEMSNEMQKEDARTTEDLAQEQTDATLSVSDKISNVLGYILEQIYEKMSFLVKIVGNIFNSILDLLSGDADKTKEKAKIEKYGIKGYGAAETKGFDDYKKSLEGGVEGGDASKAAAEFYKSRREQLKKESAAAQDKYEKIDPKDSKAKKEAMQAANAASTAVDNFDASLKKNITDIATQGMHPAQAKNVAAGISDQLSKGDIGTAFETAKSFGGGDANRLLTLGQNMIPTATTQADREATGPRGSMVRPGTKERTIRTKIQSAEAIEAGDRVARDQMQANQAAMSGGKGGRAADSNKLVAQALKSGVVTTAAATLATKVEDKNASQDTGGFFSPAAGTNASASPASYSSPTASTTEDVVKSTDDVYGGVTNIVDLLKKGIRYESGFLGGAYSNTLKTATLESFRTALMEFAIVEAKMQESPGIRRMMADYGQDSLLRGPGGMQNIIGTATNAEGNPTQIFDDMKKRVTGSMQTGGPIPDTGLYKLHRGEYVVPSVAVGNNNPGGGGGGGVVNATVNINGSNLSQQQLESAVFGAMDKIARRP